ncbi:MAG: FAD-binding oxidoreductase [Acidobacteria bacterium]|nr:FAD-binding oxidoreductase [Acidobacteriota bacterium]
MSRARYGISPWIHAYPASRRPAFPRCTTDLTAPIVIVGAGSTGCCTAYALAAAGAAPVVLEADRIGLAGTGRATGVASPEPSVSFRELQARHGRRAARAMFDASRRAVLDLGATVKRLGIRADFASVNALRGDVPDTAAKTLLREALERRKAGLEASSVKGEALRKLSLMEAPSGTRLREWARCDPYRLVLGFARAATARGAKFFERSPVVRIKHGRTAIEIQVNGRTIAAQTVIVCTSEPTALFRPLRRHFRFDEQYLVMTAPMPAALRQSVRASDLVVTDAHRPPHLIWQTSDHRLIVAGADQRRVAERAREKVLVQRTGQLMYELSRLFPAISGLAPEFGWHVPTAPTTDGAMYVGPHRNYPNHLFAWGTGHDPARAFLASRMLLRHVQGAPDSDDAYFAFTRG